MTTGRGTAAPATLVCIRGNSGSGKSTIALKLRQAYGRGLAIVEQDYIRRQVLHEKDQPGAANIDLIGAVVRRTLGAGYHTVLEGILDAGHYGAMLDDLHREHGGPQYWYYLDIPYDQTLLRHATKPNAHAFGATEMARWYTPGDLLPGGRERVIGADSTAEQSVYTILADTQLLGTTVHLSLGRPELPHTTPGADGDRLRAALVERLETEAGLTDPLLRAAFAAVRRELVVPRGYAPRAEVSGTDERVWQLLDGLHPSDRDEWLSLVYGGQSVMLHLPGQDPRTAPRGHLAVGGGFASMTTDATGAVHLLEPLTVTRGTRVLEAGTGAGLRLWDLGYTGYYAAGIRMHHPLTSPTRHTPHPLVFDGRNLLDPQQMSALGFHLHERWPAPRPEAVRDPSVRVAQRDRCATRTGLVSMPGEARPGRVWTPFPNPGREPDRGSGALSLPTFAGRSHR